MPDSSVPRPNTFPLTPNNKYSYSHSLALPASLPPSRSQYACELADAAPGDVAAALARIAAAEGVPFPLAAGAPAPRVVFGRDTRPSSPPLATRVAEGIAAAGGVGIDVGVVTTPQLHHCVRMTNALPAAAGGRWGL
jgi:phosphoacetylglucosamine mutase